MSSRRGRAWKEAEIAQALKLKEGGLTTAEIGKALDRTECGVRDLFYRLQPYHHERRLGAPIGQTSEDRHFANDAAQGSARLRAEIERVFGRAA